jgi:hypothetical protein
VHAVGVVCAFVFLAVVAVVAFAAGRLSARARGAAAVTSMAPTKSVEVVI